jgi:hypothetical protein
LALSNRRYGNRSPCAQADRSGRDAAGDRRTSPRRGDARNDRRRRSRDRPFGQCDGRLERLDRGAKGRANCRSRSPAAFRAR